MAMASQFVLCALALLAFASSASAYSAADVCEVTITVDYVDNSLDFAMTLSKAVSSASSVLPPGTFGISIDAKICDGENNAPNTVAFNGATASQTTIDGTETSAVAVSITALDQETLTDVDDSTNFAPVITSISASPAVVKYGETATLTAQGQDLPSGNPASFTITQTGGRDDALSATECTDGQGTCSITYSAALPDNGNIQFQFVAVDSDGAQSANNPTAFFLVDPNADVDLTVTNAHKPYLKDDEATFNPTDVTVDISDPSATLVTTIKVYDEDIDTDAGETITVVATASESSTNAPNGASTVSCGNAINGVAGNIVKNGADSYQEFTITWNPISSLSEGYDASTYGETYCGFSIVASDSTSQNSQTLTYLALVKGTASNAAASTGELPVIVSVMTDASVAAGASTSFVVRFSDADDNVALSITSSDLAIDESVAAQDCSASTCTETVTAAISGSQAAATYVVTVKVTDASGQETTRDVSVTVTSSRRRRDVVEVPTLMTNFRIDNGRLVASLPQEVVDQMPPAPTVTEAPNDEAEPEDEAPPKNGMSTTMVAGIAGGAAGLLVVVAAVVAVVAGRRRRGQATKVGQSASWELELPSTAFNPRHQMP